MNSIVYNPYQNIGKQFKEGMDYVIKNIPTSSKPDSSKITFDQLNHVLLDYLALIFTSDATTQSLIDKNLSISPIINNLTFGILANTANSYQYSKLNDNSYYNLQQVFLINSIIRTIKRNDNLGIISVLEDANTKIIESDLGVVDQTPLLIAVEIGRVSCNYWMDVFYNNENEWNKYLNKNVAINMASLQFWVIASMEGVLNGFAQVQRFDMNAATVINTVGRSVGGTVAMISAVGLSSGKVFFNWIKKIQDDNMRLWNLSSVGDVAALKGSKYPDGSRDQFSGRIGDDNCDFRAKAKGQDWTDWRDC